MKKSYKKVLIAEDEKPLAHALQLKLEHEGFEVIWTSDGRQCIERLKEGPFDLLLLDLVMPAMDGFQVLREIQNLSVEIKIFVLSNLSQHEDEERAKDLGASKFFVKSNTSLSTIVEEVKKA